jgi:hypothetical protein
MFRGDGIVGKRRRKDARRASQNICVPGSSTKVSVSTFYLSFVFLTSFHVILLFSFYTPSSTGLIGIILTFLSCPYSFPLCAFYLLRSLSPCSSDQNTTTNRSGIVRPIVSPAVLLHSCEWPVSAVVASSSSHSSLFFSSSLCLSSLHLTLWKMIGQLFRFNQADRSMVYKGPIHPVFDRYR